MIVKPFKAVRPKVEYVKQCAALPYDVMSSDEAREEVKNKPYSFLHVDKAEIDLDKSVDLYDDRVYQKAKENLDALESNGIYEQDENETFYFYRQVMNGRSQTGIVGCASIDDYINGKVKKHELTRADKEIDRIRHVDTCKAQTGPIFLAYKDCKALDSIIEKETEKQPLYDFVSDDGIRHVVWKSEKKETNDEIEKAFNSLSSLYIADGHHRCASAVKAGLMRREKYGEDKDGEYNYFMSVIFPEHSLKIFDYNRLLLTIGNLSPSQFLSEVERTLGSVKEVKTEGPYRPKSVHTVGMYVDKKWYEVSFYASVCSAKNPADRLDCAILQKSFLAPVLGIEDPRVDKRIDFVGGIRGLEYLEKRCSEDAVVAISMHPVSMNELISVADAGEIMPPKSTWFEPKLRSGIFIHKI